jgi:uncharacterized membrane protein YsdA (DUF1294 family)
MGRNGYNARDFVVHATATLGLAGLAAVGLWWGLGRGLDWPHGLGYWLVAVNVVAFGTGGYDKARAAAARPRVPEPVFPLLTVAGGGLGSVAAVYGFALHKVAGAGRVLLWGMAALQAALIGWLIWIMW